MRRLLAAEAYLHGVPLTDLQVNAEEKARDEGCDAWTPKPAAHSEWLGGVETCWQFKAGDAGQPRLIGAELKKPIPQSTLKRGGRFVVVASGSARGKAGRDARLRALERAKVRLGIKGGTQDVLTSESLATWLAEHPAIAGEFLGLPPGVELLSDWERDPQHQGPYFPPALMAAELKSAAAAIDLRGGTVSHIHIVGRPGVGKTRFALELCRQASWRRSVLFIRQPNEVSALQVLSSVGASPGKTLVLVVDEVRPDQTAAWVAAVARAAARVRLITIGHDHLSNADPAEIAIEPMTVDTMSKAVEAWYPAMPREQVEFIAEFASGYVRLARLASRAVNEKLGINVRDLLQDTQVAHLMDSLLDASLEDRRALHVVAVLNSVGWEGERAVEGRAIAEHLGLEWESVRARVFDFDRRLGVAPRAGDLRYISPAPLGVYLAIEAWEMHRDRMSTLASALPTEESRREYHARMRAVVAASPLARDFATAELERFRDWRRLVHDAEVERWVALSLADAVIAARVVASALRSASRDERLKIEGRARRHLVNGLVELAWGDEAFAPAALALAELAEAENETWGNNASGEFVSKFQLWLGGTARPFKSRMEVIDDLLGRDSTSYIRLAVKALAQIGNDHHHRAGLPARIDAPREPEWRPSSGIEAQEGARCALRRLAQVAKISREDLEADLVDAVRRVSGLLRYGSMREDVALLVRAVATSHPSSREDLRATLADVADRAKHFEPSASGEDVGWLSALESEIEDKSPAAQVRRLVGRRVYREAPDVGPAADLLLQDPDLWASMWPWLTSGEAFRAWELGVALAQRDGSQGFLQTMVNSRGRGPDLRVMSGCISKAVETRGPDWADDLLEEWQGRCPDDESVVLELTWGLPPTTRGATRIIKAAQSGALTPRLATQLPFGGWTNRLPATALQQLLEVLVGSPRYAEAGLSVAHARVAANPDEWQALKHSVKTLLTDPALLKAGDMTEYYWLELGKRVAQEDPRLVCKALFDAHGARDEEVWFLEHSQAVPLLDACIEMDPAGVWDELRPHLEGPEGGRFVVGLPGGLLDRMPHDAVLAWVAGDPERRALLVSRLVARDLGDGELGAKLLARYRSVVSTTMLSAWASGTWWGEASSHWESIADELEGIAGASSIKDVRSWANGAAARFRKMAEEDRKREAEESVRPGG